MARRNGTVVEAAPPRELSVEQERAIAALLGGSSDAEAAETVGVSARSISRWRAEDALFTAELNRRRVELWRGQADRLRALLAEAVGVVAEDLRSEDDEVRRAAARAILRQYGAQLALVPSGPTSAAAVERDMVFAGMLG